MSVASFTPTRPPRWTWVPHRSAAPAVLFGEAPTLSVVAPVRSASTAAVATWCRVASIPTGGGTLLGGWLLALAGHAVLAAGAALLLGADLGSVGWSVLHVGIAGLSGLSLGNAAVLTAAVCLVMGVLAGWRPTPVVVLAAAVGAVSVDAVAGVLPVVHGLWQWVMALAGSLAMATGSGTYLAAGVGESAHDVPFALVHRSGLPLGAAALVVTATMTALGLALGGPVGPASLVVLAVLTAVVPPVARRVEAHVGSWGPVVEVTELPVL